MKDVKGKIQTVIGFLVIGFLIFGLVRGCYNRNLADPVTVVTSGRVASPVKNALFWHEKELEKTAFAFSSELSLEESLFIQPLYEDLKATGLVSEQITTMSEIAVEKMIELDAYPDTGTEPDVLEIAEEGGYPYIFEITITEAKGKKNTNDLNSVKYLFSLYDVPNDSILWEAESTRLSGFWGGGMPKGDKLIAALKKHLKEANIIE
ncbi:MAG: hypothetical protein LBE91_19685 [Tannerella sp.]|jgi:hypothetical protein|nr:hypothetical protein [Tannerella sp.]